MSDVNVVDLVALQEHADKIAREEYKAAYEALEVERRRIHVMNDTWRRIVTTLALKVGTVSLITDPDEDELQSAVEKVGHAVVEYGKLSKLIRAIQENPMTQGQWDRMVMTLRLSGGDEV